MGTSSKQKKSNTDKEDSLQVTNVDGVSKELVDWVERNWQWIFGSFIVILGGTLLANQYADFRQQGKGDSSDRLRNIQQVYAKLKKNEVEEERERDLNSLIDSSEMVDAIFASKAHMGFSEIYKAKALVFNGQLDVGISTLEGGKTISEGLGLTKEAAQLTLARLLIDRARHEDLLRAGKILEKLINHAEILPVEAFRVYERVNLPGKEEKLDILREELSSRKPELETMLP